MTYKNSRKLKIHAKFRPRSYDHTIVPQIKLEGEWLKELGFEIGQEINVEPKKSQLIITIHKKSA